MRRIRLPQARSGDVVKDLSRLGRPRRLHERRRQAINGVRDDLIRRGSCPRRAVRYARELQAHWEDLRDESMQRGFDEVAAEAEADRRLGSARELVAAAVGAHRRETFAGRHPVVAFGLLPLASVVLVACLFCLLVLMPLSFLLENAASDDMGTKPLPRPPMSARERNEVRVFKGFLIGWSYAVPPVLAIHFYRRARGCTLSRTWPWVAGIAVALGAAGQAVRLRYVTNGDPASLTFSVGPPQDPGLFLAALSAAAAAAWVAHRRSHLLLGSYAVVTDDRPAGLTS